VTENYSIGVVIRALNEEEHVGRLLMGLAQQTRVPDQIVLVDSGSSDSTVPIAERLGAEITHISPQDFSFGRSLNVGFEACETDLVLLLSAHLYPVFDTFVEKLVAPFGQGQVAVSYGRQVGDWRTQFSELRIMRQWFPEAGSGPQEHPFSNNANACVRRRVWELMPYDEDLTGLEDVDFASRAQGKGFEVHYVAEAPVVHVHQESWSQVTNRYRREAIAYRRLHPGWRFGALEALGTASRNLAADLVHAAVERRPLVDFPRAARFRAAQFWGTWQGAQAGLDVDDKLRRRMYYPAEVRPFSDFDQSMGILIDYGSHEVTVNVD